MNQAALDKIYNKLESLLFKHSNHCDDVARQRRNKFEEKTNRAAKDRIHEAGWMIGLCGLGLGLSFTGLFTEHNSARISSTLFSLDNWKNIAEGLKTAGKSVSGTQTVAQAIFESRAKTKESQAQLENNAMGQDQQKAQQLNDQLRRTQEEKSRLNHQLFEALQTAVGRR
jgi:hypothetical protein